MFRKKCAEEDNKKPGFLQRLRAHLNKGDSWLTYDIANLAPGGKIDDDVIDELEAELVMADVGMEAVKRIVGDLQKRLARKESNDVEALRQGLHDALLDVLKPVEEALVIPESEGPFVILMVGVNGAEKPRQSANLRNVCRTKASASCSPPAIHSVPQQWSNCRSGASATMSLLSHSRQVPTLPPSCTTRTRQRNQEASMCFWPIPRGGCRISKA